MPKLTTRQQEAADALRLALAEVVDPGEIDAWLANPNPAFGGDSPVDLIRRNDTDPLWRMVYQLGSGSPS